jgi:hypothetical protein
MAYDIAGKSKKPVRELSDYRKMFDDFRNTTQDNRSQCLIDIDYYDGHQLSTDERALLKARGQPDIVINRTRVAINGILGVTARARSEPRCWPRTPNDEDSADVATDCLRYIGQKNRFNYMRVDLYKDMLLAGTAAVLIIPDQDKEIKYIQIRWEEFFCDPRSRRPDCKDARYMGIAKWMFTDTVAALYPDFGEDLEDAGGGGVGNGGLGGIIDESFEDRPNDVGTWIDNRNRRIMVVELYHKWKGTWHKCVFYGGGVLEEGVSPYLDEKKRPDCPIEARSAYVDRNNNRYGAIRDMRDIQDEINKRRSKLLFHISSSQIQAEDPSAIETDPDEARKEAARPDGVIPLGWKKVSTTDMSQGQMQLLAESKSEMERMGPNPAVLGRQGSDSSGRALLTRQQAGLVELAVLFDGLEDLELRVYRQAWARAKQFWTDKMFIRVTDDIESPRFLEVNQPMGAPQIDPSTGQPMVDGQGQPVLGEPQFDPETGESAFGYKNKVADMDVDIIIDTTPETATLMQEQLNELMKLVGSNPGYAAEVPFEVMLQMTPIPRKRELIATIRKHREQVQQGQAQQQQAEMQAQMTELAAKVKQLETKSTLNLAQAELAHAEAEAVPHDTASRTATAAHSILDTAEHPPEGQSGQVAAEPGAA